MSDYDNTPFGFKQLMEEWFETEKRPRPLYRRIVLWLFTPLTWRATKWIYPSIYGISTQSYPNWHADHARPSVDGVNPQPPNPLRSSA